MSVCFICIGGRFCTVVRITCKLRFLCSSCNLIIHGYCQLSFARPIFWCMHLQNEWISLWAPSAWRSKREDASRNLVSVSPCKHYMHTKIKRLIVWKRLQQSVRRTIHKMYFFLMRKNKDNECCLTKRLLQSDTTPTCFYFIKYIVTSHVCSWRI